MQLLEALDLRTQVIDVDLGCSVFVNRLKLHLDEVDFDLLLLLSLGLGAPHRQEVDL